MSNAAPILVVSCKKMNTKNSFQKNFSYLRDLPFVVYFDFEMTIRDNVFNNKKMFVISYCQKYAFHPDLNLDKIVVFCSFQQTEDETDDLNHFCEEYVKYFDKVTFDQLNDSATDVLNRVKSMSPSEMFRIKIYN